MNPEQWLYRLKEMITVALPQVVCLLMRLLHNYKPPKSITETTQRSRVDVTEFD